MSARLTAPRSARRLSGGRPREHGGERHRPPLSPAIERRLLARAQRGERRARDELVKSFMPLVSSMARMYRGPTAVEPGELVQEGVVGILKALERYDPSLGTPFWPYASWWVRQAMQHLVAERTRPLVLSDRALRQLARLKQARRAHEQAEGSEPSAADLSRETGLSRGQIDNLSAVDRTPRSLEEQLGGDGEMGSTVGDTLADERAEEAFDRVDRALEVEQLHGASEGLCDRERQILLSHFGIRRPAQTLRQIGSHLGLSAERVRQVEEGALDKLRGAALAR